MAYFTGLNFSQPDDPNLQTPYIPQAAPASMATNNAPAPVGTPLNSQGPLTSSLANVPQSVFQNIQSQGPGYGDQSLMGNAYNRGSARLYNNFESQYGQGATPFALKSLSEGGMGMDPSGTSLFNPFEKNSLGSQGHYVGGPNAGYQYGYGNDARFYLNPLLRNAYSGEAANAYSDQNRPGGAGAQIGYDPLSGLPSSLRGWGDQQVIGPNQNFSNPYEGYFGDDYLRGTLNNINQAPLGPNSMNSIYNMPDLNQFRRDFIYGSRPDQLASRYSGGSTGDLNPYGSNWTNPNTVNWANAAMNYLPKDELRNYLANQGVNVWF